MISESDLAELIIPHSINDLVTFHRLAQVSKRFNVVSKKLLIRREEIDFNGIKFVWTELPNRLKHGHSRLWHPNGQLTQDYNYINGELQGVCKNWYLNGQLTSEWNYFDNDRHGLCKGWYPNGELIYSNRYSYGKLIEKLNN